MVDILVELLDGQFHKEDVHIFRYLKPKHGHSESYEIRTYAGDSIGRAYDDFFLSLARKCGRCLVSEDFIIIY